VLSLFKKPKQKDIKPMTDYIEIHKPKALGVLAALIAARKALNEALAEIADMKAKEAVRIAIVSQLDAAFDAEMSIDVGGSTGNVVG
jgi:hypothetical protein